MKKLLLILLPIVMMFSCDIKENQKEELFVVDRKDEKSTAKAILIAYKAKDLKSLSNLSHSYNVEFFDEIIEQGQQHPRYSSLFNGWRWNAVKMWDGTSLEVVENYNDRARVRFNNNKVVTLEFEDGKWCFEDIHNY